MKRLLSAYTCLASQEVHVLKQTDDHANVVRYFWQVLLPFPVLYLLSNCYFRFPFFCSFMPFYFFCFRFLFFVSSVFCFSVVSVFCVVLLLLFFLSDDKLKLSMGSTNNHRSRTTSSSTSPWSCVCARCMTSSTPRNTSLSCWLARHHLPPPLPPLLPPLHLLHLSHHHHHHPSWTTKTFCCRCCMAYGIFTPST